MMMWLIDAQPQAANAASRSRRPAALFLPCSAVRHVRYTWEVWLFIRFFWGMENGMVAGTGIEAFFVPLLCIYRVIGSLGEGG